MSFKIWGITCNDLISDKDKKYLLNLPSVLPSLQWVWDEIDRVWDSFELNNKKPLLEQDINSFYSHPVWIMNGLFSEADPISKNHRIDLAKFIDKNNMKKIADYGGGSGVFAEFLFIMNPLIVTDIIEPYPIEFFKKKILPYASINFVNNFTCNNYDAVISQSVLEHIENPIETAYEMASNVKEGGLVIFADCYYPVIKCHLPSTFYLRHTFKFIMKKMGLDFVGRIPNVDHALIFRRKQYLNLNAALSHLKTVKLVGRLLNIIWPFASKVKHLFR
jgi:2-polyprenyl-3-methyl-5-hydroxy-6-metoxy-1,4-benzoquinol methylase